jgi:SNF2 family DNA or RNA helicase
MSELAPLWKHQERVIGKAKTLPYFGLFHEVGTGKTRSMIRILCDKFNEKKRVLKTVILCPIIVSKNWPREFEKYSKVTQDKIFVTYNKNPKKRYENLKKALEKNNGNMIIVVNFEGMLDEKLREIIMAWGPEVLITDESQRCKNPAAKRTKHTIALSDKVMYSYILSGTPILKSPMDVWAQFRILDKGQRFGRNFFSFRAKYFYDKNAGMPSHLHFPDWHPRVETMEEMHDLIYEIADLAEKKDCLDLPPLVRQVTRVELSPEQRKIYNDLRDDYVAYINREKADGTVEESSVMADLAIVKGLRLQQIVSGFVKLDDGTELFFDDTEREKALEEHLETIVVEAKKKVIVWSVFKHNYTTIKKVCDKLGIKYLEAHGDISAKKKLENVDIFNSDQNEYCVFIGHPASLGVGINLVPASFMIYFSRDYNLENDLQSEARNYRGGSEIHESITRIDIVAANTVDEQVVEALAEKVKISNRVLKKFITEAA